MCGIQSNEVRMDQSLYLKFMDHVLYHPSSLLVDLSLEYIWN